jgi:hypothetical protein
MVGVGSVLLFIGHRSANREQHRLGPVPLLVGR